MNRQTDTSELSRAITIGARSGVHAPEQHGAEDDLFAAAGAGDDLPEREVAEARETDSQAPGLGTEPFVERGRQEVPCFGDAGSVAAYFAEAKGRRRIVDVAQQVAEESLVLGSAHAEARLGDEISERLGPPEIVSSSAQKGIHLGVQDLHR